jgi:hypothetical protein
MTTSDITSSAALDAADELRGTMQGKVVVAGEEGYTHVRQIWNGAVTHQPALFALCETVADADVRLPRTYVEERHLVPIDRPGSERPAYEERPGPGPDIETDPNTIFFVPSPRES